MINMRYAAIVSVLMLFMGLPAAFAEKTIAVHPLKGEPKDIAETFFTDLAREISEYSIYVPYFINLEDDETLHINTGGLPAYICPQPVLTKDSPYAMTGEVREDPDFQNMYNVRLYLWDMTYRVLLVSDEMVVHDEEEYLRHLSRFVTWILSYIDMELLIEPEQETSPAQVVVQREEVSAEPDYWLRLGLRAGGGDSSWYYNIENKDDFTHRKCVTDFTSVNAALQASTDILSWLAIQTEVNFCVDLKLWNTGETGGDFTSAYLIIPLLVKANWRSGSLMASIFTGPYVYLPLFHTENKTGSLFDYKPNLPGFIFGGSIGWKMGPGLLFTDARFEYDGLLWDAPSPDQTYYRNTVRVNIGYEMSFFRK